MNIPLEFNYVEHDGKLLKVGVFTYCCGINLFYTLYQKKVFNHFKIIVNQINQPFGHHGTFMTRICREVDADYYVFFDVDAIPLRSDFLKIAIERIYGEIAVVGIEQKNNYPDENSEIYAGPPCFAISKDTYKWLGEPSYEIIWDPRIQNRALADTGQNLCTMLKEKGGKVKLFKFDRCLVPHVNGYEVVGSKGFGSYFEDLVFHNWESRIDNHIHLFINVCKEILGE